MIKSILCIAVLVLASKANTWVPSSGIPDKLPGGPNCESYTWGNGKVYQDNKSFADCKALCENAPEAQGFECDAIIYKFSQSRCWLRGPECDNLDIVANDASKKSLLYTEYDQTTEWCLMDKFTSSQTCSADKEHAQFTGSVSTLEDCKAFCAFHEECKYFFFNSDNNCNLYTDCSIDDVRIPGYPGDTYGLGSCPLCCMGLEGECDSQYEGGFLQTKETCEVYKGYMEGACTWTCEETEAEEVTTAEPESGCTYEPVPADECDPAWECSGRDEYGPIGDYVYDYDCKQLPNCPMVPDSSMGEDYRCESDTFWFSLNNGMTLDVNAQLYSMRPVGTSGKLDNCGEADDVYKVVCDAEPETTEPETTEPESDCFGVPGGNAVTDACGVCDGDDSSCADCAGVANGNAQLDACSVCGGDNSSCEDCNGVAMGPSNEDDCGVCDGDNSSCADCAGVANGNAVADVCGVCQGDGSSCALACEDFNEKKPCKKETAAEGLQCTWYKHIDACKPNDWEPVCSESIYQDIKVCKKMGCFWSIDAKLCYDAQPACTDKWAEVASLKKRGAKIKHKGIWSTDDCLDKAKEIGAKGIVYDLVHYKGICLTFATTDFNAGVSDDANEVVWAYGCMLDEGTV